MSHSHGPFSFSGWISLGLVTSAILLRPPVRAAGVWTRLAKGSPGPLGLMLLLSDGKVMAQQLDGKLWYLLTPDIRGSYVNGSWSTLVPMQDTRTWYSSVVLRDGRVFVAGGEYGSGESRAELYDPLSNFWTPVAVPPDLLDPTLPSPGFPGKTQAFSDSISMILPDGRVLLAPKAPGAYGGTLVFNPDSNAWSAGPKTYRGGRQDEVSWVKLPDDSILTVDPFGVESERFIPASNTWITDGIVPVSLYGDPGGELGAALLLPDGRAFFLGGSGHTAFYTPSGDTHPGVWSAGPDIPDGYVAPDAPAAMMVNGRILCVVGPRVETDPGGGFLFPPPTVFYEFDPGTNLFTPVASPNEATDTTPPYNNWMLALPDGTVLHGFGSRQLTVYKPEGPPLDSGKPAIAGIIAVPDGSFHLTGRLLNGISAGAAYGDDAQMDSNYPLVRLVDGVGNLHYARTFNWSRTGVMTGAALVSTEFRLPPGLPAGAYELVVVANGISSDPFPFQWADRPLPDISFSGGDSVRLSWPSPSPGWQLQLSTSLGEDTWAVVDQSVADDGTQRSVTLKATAEIRFFRLLKP